MYIIKNEYENKGTKYRIRNLNFANLSELSDCGWKFVTESHNGDGFEFISKYDDKIGTLVYHDQNNPNVGYRIYSDYADYLYTYYDDYMVVSKLQEKQKDIKLLEFPTGIITVGDKVIGQEMPFYEGYKELGYALYHNQTKEVITFYYLKVIEILKELLQNGIYYLDVHSGNFLINTINDDIKVIDFERQCLEIEPNNRLKEVAYDRMINNLKIMINKLNKLRNVFLSGDFVNAKTLEDIEKCVLESHQVLIKRK